MTEQGMLEARSRMLPAKQLTHQDALFVGKGVTIDFRPAWALGSNNCRVWV